jgi:hypothetical protein
MGQSLTKEIMTKEIGGLRDAIQEALKGTESEGFGFKFVQERLPYGKRVTQDAFDEISYLEDQLINGGEVSSSFLGRDLGL